MNYTLNSRVDIEIGLSRPVSRREMLPRICVVGIVPMNAPIIAEQSPYSLIRKSDYSPDFPYIEQVRLSSVQQTVLLPGIGNRWPSRLRDCLNTALAIGCPEVDFILARAPGVLPWSFTEQSVKELLLPYLNEVPGAILVFPDAGGPWPRRHIQASHSIKSPNIFERQKALKGMLQGFAPSFSENYQVALVDVVPISTEQNRFEAYLASLLGVDAALCSWAGPEAEMTQHAWRSAAMCKAAYLSKRVDVVTQSVIGHRIPLGKGRKVVRDRSTLFGAPLGLPVSPALAENCVVLQLEDGGRSAQVLSEVTLRRPKFEWTIPAIRTVKGIHQAIRQAADMFVFRAVGDVEAFALEQSIQIVLAPFFDRGILVGPDGQGQPVVSGSAIKDPSAPMLAVDLSAQIRPWFQSVNLKVMVRNGEQPEVVQG